MSNSTKNRYNYLNYKMSYTTLNARMGFVYMFEITKEEEEEKEFNIEKIEKRNIYISSHYDPEDMSKAKIITKMNLYAKKQNIPSNIKESMFRKPEFVSKILVLEEYREYCFIDYRSKEPDAKWWYLYKIPTIPKIKKRN